MPGVSLKAVSKQYGRGHHVLENLNLDIRDGELLVLLGASGCGKTTTLRIIAGLESLTAGDIEFDGSSISHLAPKDRNVAMVFQSSTLYPHLNVEQNLAFALKARRLPKDEIRQRILHAADLLSLGSIMNVKPQALSGGQRQRVALGRAIAAKQAVWLMDEPLSHLDAQLRITLRTELKTLHQSVRTTTVYVTHDQEEAMSLADRIAVMAQGTLQQIAPPMDLYHQPANRFVASFVGSPPMNFLPGTMQADSRWACECDPSLTLPISGCSASPGTPAVLGFRPQAATISTSPAPDALHVRLVTLEPLGDQIDLSCALEANNSTRSPHTPLLKLRVPARSDFVAAQSLWITPDPNRVCMFEPGEFGSRL